MLGRALATVALVFALGACGSRTPLRVDDDEALDEAGAAGTGAGDGGRSGDRGGAGDGSGGRGGSGAGGEAGANNAGDGSAGDGNAGMSAGAASGGRGGFGAGGFGAGGSGGTGGFGGAGAGGASGFTGGFGGESGFGGAGEGGYSGMAGQILNPQDCATPHPFVLSIDPAGASGSVRGWLESTAGLVFEDQLPRFVRGYFPDPASYDRGIALWWSIGGVDGNGEGSLYFYGGDYTSSTSEVAVAIGANRFADIAADALDFARQNVEARTGSFIVYRNASTDETVALRIDQIFITDPAGDALCAAVDASWRFVR